MALIIHRCACGHPDFFHLPTAHPCTNCTCRALRPGPSELLPTFDSAGQPVETVTEPGAAWGGGGKTCGCDDCRNLYTQMVGVA